MLRYWYPPEGGGAIGSDNMVVLKGAKNPVLAHQFINFMLDSKNAFDNFYNLTGYQPPMNDIDTHRLSAKASSRRTWPPRWCTRRTSTRATSTSS